MTLTDLRGPIAIGGGGLVVLDHGRLDPLLAEAVLLLRASRYAGSGDWPNEGTGADVAPDPGDFGGPFLLDHDGTDYLWHPGWADETIRADASGLPSGTDVWVFRLDFDPDRSVCITGLGASHVSVGNDADGLAVKVGFEADGDVTLAWSEDGAAVVNMLTVSDGHEPTGRQRRAITFDPVTGTMSVWSQALGEDFTDEPGVDPSWVLVGSEVNAGGATTVAATVGDVETGLVAGVSGEWSGGSAQFGGRLYRLAVSGAGMAGAVDTGEGLAGIGGWTFRRATPETPSYSVQVVTERNVAFGNNSRFLLPSAIGDALGAASFTLALRYLTYSDVASGSDGAMVIASGAAGNVFDTSPGFILLYLNGPGGLIALVNSGGGPMAVTHAVPSVGDWHLLVVRVDRGSDELEVFVDGASVGTADISALGDISWAGDVMSIGAQPGLAGGTFGSSHHAIWDRVLTDAEITDLGAIWS